MHRGKRVDPTPKEYYIPVGETKSVGICCEKKSPIITHVEPGRGITRPGIGEIESVIDHEIEQVTPVPRVDRSIGSSTQIPFPFSMGKPALAFVVMDEAPCEVCPETGLEGFHKGRTFRPRPGESQAVPVATQESGDDGVFLCFGVFEVKIESAKAGPDDGTQIQIEKLQGGGVRLLFFEVFVNVQVVSDHLGVCFDRRKLDRNGGQSGLPEERSRGTRTIGRNSKA